MSSERLEVEIIKIVKKYDELVAIETGHDQFLSYRQLLDEVQLLYKFFVDNFQITFGEHQQCLVRQCFNESVFLICLERSSINAIPSMLASLCLGGRFIFIPHDMIEREFDRLVEVLKPIAIITDGKLNEKLELLIKTYHKKEETELEKLREKFNASKYRRLTIDELKGNYIDDRENVGDIDQHFRVHRYYENYLKQKIFGCYETDEVISFDLPIIIDLSKLDRSKFEISKNWIPKRNMNCKNNSIAYFIYTSGTTSTSKLVPIYHKDLLHRLTTSSCFDGIYSTDRISQIFNLTFDASMMEIFGALLHAATIVIVPDEVSCSSQL
ncbi:hypothetical protein SNEBB_001234 [Seison nebaliae]|nr:hypothetical protein SNEBB_001234 [Seison nebaliae]